MGRLLGGAALIDAEVADDGVTVEVDASIFLGGAFDVGFSELFCDGADDETSFRACTAF